MKAHDRLPLATLAVVPVYNHEHAVGSVVDGILAAGLPCLLVDDGSTPDCARALDELVKRRAPQVTLVRLTENLGKGGAVVAGMREASRLGYSHVLQIDADGQHDTADIPHFLEHSQAQPDAVICGCPQYDDSVPRGRLYGRYATHIWVWINTLSLDIRDSMCGFRIYPLPSTMALIDSASLGSRMDFDTEIMVRLHWRGLRVVNVTTRVRYPSDGISHFRMGWDNLLISRMHAALFFGMLLRAPRLLWRRLRTRGPQ
ncbi:MAG: glycosyltransferase family 2 protein [Rhodocyclaceae bacterium]